MTQHTKRARHPYYVATRRDWGWLQVEARRHQWLDNAAAAANTLARANLKEVYVVVDLRNNTIAFKAEYGASIDGTPMVGSKVPCDDQPADAHRAKD